MKDKLIQLAKKPWAAYTIATCSAVILYMLLNNLAAVKSGVDSIIRLLSPVFTGIVVAYLFNPLEDFFEKKVFHKIADVNKRHFSGVLLTVICVILLIALLLTALIPSTVKSAKLLSENWESYTEKAQELLEKVQNFCESHGINVDLSNINALLKDGMNKVVKMVKDNSTEIMSKVSAVGSSVSNFFIGVLFGFCFLFAEKTIVRFIGLMRRSVIREDRIEKHNEILSHCHKVFSRYVVCTLLDAAIIGVATLIFTLFLSPEYAPLIAVICAITNIIPTFGPWIGSAISIFFLVLVKPSYALWYFIFSCILQSIDGLVIKTKLFKGGLGIPASWTMVLLIIGGKIAGMAGIILSIPAAAILVILYNETIKPKLEKRKDKINDEDEAEEPAKVVSGETQ